MRACVLMSATYQVSNEWSECKAFFWKGKVLSSSRNATHSRLRVVLGVGGQVQWCRVFFLEGERQDA